MAKKKTKTEQTAERLFFNDNGRPDGLPGRIAAQRFTKLLTQHQRNEARLRRAFRAWEKTDAAMRRAEKRLEKQTADHGGKE